MEPAVVVNPLADEGGRIGVYFGLPMQDYLDDPALGSSDIRLLRNNPTTYWDQSWMNPSRERESASYLDVGTAVHMLLLEGDAAFAQQFMSGAVHTADMTPAEKGALTKAANAKAAALGMTALKAADYDRVLKVRTVLKMSPDLASAFEDGFAEVSVFWMRNGVRRKARLDYIKIGGTGDLKTASNPYGRDFRECAKSAIANYGYHIQAAHYMEARARLRQFAEQGAAFSCPKPDLLKKIIATAGIGWQWVFWSTDGAPDVCSFKLGNDHPMLESARRSIELGISRYVRYKRAFGTKQWATVRPVENLAYEDMPFYFDRFTDEERQELADWEEWISQ